MSITRRKFLKAGSLVALAAAIPLRATGQHISKGATATRSIRRGTLTLIRWRITPGRPFHHI